MHYTNHLGNEEFESHLSSRYEDKEMVSPIDVDESKYENFKEGLASVFTLDNKVETCIEGFRNESWSIRNGYPKQDNEENIFRDTICMVEEMESESSSNSDFSSYVESLHEDEMGSEFKVYTNALYDEDFDDDQPIFCQNFQKGSLLGTINPLFEEDMEVSD